MIYTIRRQSKSRRFNLRATGSQEKLIRVVAELEGQSVTDFILESACKEAEQKLADQQHFLLSESQWKAFTKALDRPVQTKPRLRKLFSEPSILESK